MSFTTGGLDVWEWRRMENLIGTLVRIGPVRDRKRAIEHLLDLAEHALASHGLGENCLDKNEVRLQVKYLSETDTREHLQQLVDAEIKAVYGESAAELIRPLSSYEHELNRYKASVQAPSRG